VLVGVDGFEKMEAVEVWPEAVGDEDLGVGDLPEEEVRDALFAGGADDQVWVGHVRSVEGAGDAGLIEGLEGARTKEIIDGTAAGVGFGREIGKDAADGVDDLGSSPVVEGQGEGGPSVLCRGFRGPLHGVLHLLWEVVGAADVGHADVVVVHALHIANKVALEELHEEADLGLGAAQVIFEGERVERQPGKVDAGGCFNDVLNGFGTLLVAEKSLERTFACPPAIAVHDDGYVLGNFCWVDLVIDTLLFGREFMAAIGNAAVVR